MEGEEGHCLPAGAAPGEGGSVPGPRFQVSQLGFPVPQPSRWHLGSRVCTAGGWVRGIGTRVHAHRQGSGGTPAWAESSPPQLHEGQLCQGHPTLPWAIPQEHPPREHSLQARLPPRTALGAWVPTGSFLQEGLSLTFPGPPPPAVDWLLSPVLAEGRAGARSQGRHCFCF